VTLRASFVYDDVLSQHILREDHVMVPTRLRHTYELLDSYEAFDQPTSRLVRPRQATEEEVLSYHSREYMEAVKSFSRGETKYNSAAFNFSDTGDNPTYPGMYEAAIWSTGASLVGADLVATREADVAFNVSGGLHHAMPGHASGFCVFNDPVIAINSLLARGARVAYVDIDAHHGDGVQHAFYDTDDVLTISLHESGSFLFPGTGSTEEIGTGKGRGYSVNVPLYPYTSDDTYLWTFREVVPPLLEAFRPDFLVTQLGLDTHYLDPITHIALTVQGFAQVVRELSQLAPQWLALGGGGYDIGAVARGWTLAYGVMSNQTFPDHIPDSYREKYGLTQLSDAEGPQIDEGMRKEARRFAEKSVLDIQRTVFPIHGLRVG